MTVPSFATYATIADARRVLNETQTISPADAQGDMQLLEALRWATRYIEHKTKKIYFPYLETRYFSAGSEQFSGDITGYELNLGTGNGLIESVTVTNGDGSAIASTDYVLHPKTSAPYFTIRNLYTGWVGNVTDGNRDAIAITGRWADSDRGTATWITGYDTVQNNPLSSSAETVTVAWTNNYDPLRRFPRFSAGMLGRFGTTEYFTILETNYAQGGTSTLRIRRGERGTTPAEHATGTAISIWEVDEQIRSMCAELAVWKYRDSGRDDAKMPEWIVDVIKSSGRYFVGAV